MILSPEQVAMKVHRLTCTQIQSENARNRNNSTVNKELSRNNTPENKPVIPRKPLLELQGIARRLREYAQDPKSISIGAFIRDEGVVRATMVEWRKRCPELQEAYEFAKEAIGTNRMDGAIHKKLDLNAIKLGQYRLTPEFGEDERRQIALRTEAEKELHRYKTEIAQQVLQDIEITLTKMPHSGLVPDFRGTSARDTSVRDTSVRDTSVRDKRNDESIQDICDRVKAQVSNGGPVRGN